MSVEVWGVGMVALRDPEGETASSNWVISLTVACTRCLQAQFQQPTGQKDVDG